MQQCMFVVVVVVVPYQYEAEMRDFPPYFVGSTGCSSVICCCCSLLV